MPKHNEEQTLPSGTVKDNLCLKLGSLPLTPYQNSLEDIAKRFASSEVAYESFIISKASRHDAQLSMASSINKVLIAFMLEVNAAIASQQVSGDPANPELTCSCGDSFEANSFGAGYLAAAGHCFGCDAELKAASSH